MEIRFGFAGHEKMTMETLPALWQRSQHMQMPMTPRDLQMPMTPRDKDMFCGAWRYA